MSEIEDLKAALSATDPAESVRIKLGDGDTEITLAAEALARALGIILIPKPKHDALAPGFPRKKVRVITAFVRLRAGPSISTAELGRFSQGEVIEMIDMAQPPKADGFTWLPTADGRGWVAIENTTSAEVGPVWPLPFNANQRGVGTSAGGWAPTPRELELIRQNRIEFTLICSYERGQASSAIAALRGAGVRSFVIRAAAQGISPNPQDFVDKTLPTLREYGQAIGPNDPFMIALHNEPNLVKEGWTTAWSDGVTFSRWYIAVATAYRQAFPNAKIGFPALSPGGDVHGVRMREAAFIAGCGEAIRASDWIGVHYYWVDPVGGDINPPIATWRAWFGDMSIVGTEVGPADSTPVTVTAVRTAYQKFAQIGVPAVAWVLEGAGAWQNASWVLNNVVI